MARRDRHAYGGARLLTLGGGTNCELEPQGSQVCENVGVLGTVRCGRGGQCFVVRYLETGNSGRLVHSPISRSVLTTLDQRPY